MEALPCGATNQQGVGVSDDEEQEYGRIVPLGQFIERVKARADIFSIDTDSRLSKVEAACMILAVATGIAVGTVEIARPASIIPVSTRIETLPGTVSLSTGAIEVNANSYTKVIQKPDAPEKLTLKPVPAPRLGSNHFPGGVGSSTARIARDRAFTMLSDRLSGSAIPGVDGGTAVAGVDRGMNAILLGLNSLVRGGGAGSGRLTAPGIGTANGHGISGFDGGPGDGLGDPLEGLFASDGTPVTLQHTRHSKSLDNLTTAGLSLSSARMALNGRSKSSILRTVTENLPALRYAYNRWLRTHPGTAGKITVKFAIDEFGNVVFCEVLNGTLKDAELADQVMTIVKTWRFGKIDKPGDITEAVYPLAFSM
jgi:hypothetical protein